MDEAPTPTETGAPTPDDIVAGLVEIWQGKLKLPAVGRDDDFFELGGDSVLAVEMLLEVERRFDRPPPLSLLTSGLTIARLADWLDSPGDDPDEVHARVLVPLRAEGSKPPFFLVHGVGLPTLRGTFVENLDPAQPIYLFQHRGLDGKTAPNRTIEAMAADYIVAMREVRPEGPFFVGGVCAGAFVALEMAHQLTGRGESAPMIFLVDPPLILHAFVGRSAIVRYGRRGSAFLWRKLTRGFSRGQRKRRDIVDGMRMRARTESAIFSTASDQTTHDGVRKAQDVFVKALRAYRPKPYRGVIHLVCPMGREDWRRSVDAFWPDAYDDVRVHGIGGNHSQIYAENLPDLARHLQHCLDAAGDNRK